MRDEVKDEVKCLKIYHVMWHVPFWNICDNLQMGNYILWMKVITTAFLNQEMFNSLFQADLIADGLLDC